MGWKKKTWGIKNENKRRVIEHTTWKMLFETHSVTHHHTIYPSPCTPRSGRPTCDGDVRLETRVIQGLVLMTRKQNV